MKKTLKYSLLTALMVGLFAGCASKEVDPNIENSKLDLIKTSESSYSFKPLQMKVGRVMTGVSSVVEKEKYPVYITTTNCNLLAEASQNDIYSMKIQLTKGTCEINGVSYATSDLKGWIMKDNYVGMNYSKKNVESRAEENKSEKIYGIAPNQEVKIFIEQGSLDKIQLSN